MIFSCNIPWVYLFMENLYRHWDADELKKKKTLLTEIIYYEEIWNTKKMKVF